MHTSFQIHIEPNPPSTQNTIRNCVSDQSQHTATAPEQAGTSLRRNKGKEKVTEEETTCNLGGTCVRRPRRNNVGHGVYINEASGETIFNVCKQFSMLGFN